MRIVRTITALRKSLGSMPAFSPNLSFAPTMGALHQGHIQLITAAKAASTTVVASIFINPTQFNNAVDFAKYPKSLEGDIEMLEAAGTDILFLPSVEEMYPNGTAAAPHYSLGNLETLLEGAHRPGHFQGVCQIVHSLLQAVKPGKLFMGQKDFQQCMVIQHMLHQTQLPVSLQIIPTIREPDGLAMSSRNRRLSAEDRTKAVAMYEQLSAILKQSGQSAFRQLETMAIQNLLAAGFWQVDYVSIAVAASLEPATDFSFEKQLVVLAAAHLGEVRLIDNMLFPTFAKTT